MNIGIITQPLHNNYGGLLQNYALQRVLISQGHTPITIDQKAIEYPKWRVFIGRVKGTVMHLINPIKYSKPKYILTSEEKDYIERNTRQFINTNIRHSPKCAGGESFKRVTIVHGVEGLIVGSDQCWRPKYNAYIEDMFLKFSESIPIKRRVAYAASFGTESWEFSPELTEKCAMLAKKFDMITVREASGVELCKKYLDVEATQVLDPTMLLNKMDYIKLVENENEPQSPGDLFYYILDPCEEKQTLIHSLAEKYSLKPFTVMPKYQAETRTKADVKKRIEDCVFPSVTSWLRAFVDAKMVVVDSFHGAVFSIIFNKPFWVVQNGHRGNARFDSLLSLFGLKERIINVEGEADWDKSIDWETVNEILKLEQVKSLKSLEILMENN